MVSYHICKSCNSYLVLTRVFAIDNLTSTAAHAPLFEWFGQPIFGAYPFGSNPDASNSKPHWTMIIND